MSGDDREVTRIEFHMVVNDRRATAIFIRPQKIDELLAEEKCSLGEWLRALRDSPDIPHVPKIDNGH